MTEEKEKLTVQVSEQGVVIAAAEGVVLDLTPVEALMLLDILRGEEGHLRTMADAASPLPVKITLKNHGAR